MFFFFFFFFFFFLESYVVFGRGSCTTTFKETTLVSNSTALDDANFIQPYLKYVFIFGVYDLDC